jgi:glyoxylase-like metal-dependent hydrolase (beta-lactamase superfamily II)/rhodanese-related sulfurtransferase/peroxiredoxin
MAKIKPEFDRRGVKIIGLSVDPVDSHARWEADIEATQGAALNYPLIADSDFTISKLYGMLPASTSGDPLTRTPADNQTVRNVFVIGPDKKIKQAMVYPMTTGRNFDEVLRVVDSLQLTARHRVSTPVNYLACLSHASYLIGDEATGRAVVVDPRCDVGVYLDEAAQRGLRIERVIETHIHADFVSGHLELANRAGAVISYGAGADVGFPIEPLHDGQRLSLGEVVLEIVATPGHTPESICVVVWEHPDDPAPYGVLTGDTLFVGDVGRPDLLASASSNLSADALARRLYRSLHDKLLVLPDTTPVYPAHGAGSACGKALSTETTSTIGEQRRTNCALQEVTEAAFVAAVTEGQPARPSYFAFDARANREAHALLHEQAPSLLDLDDVLARRDAGAVFLDAREPADFAVAHLAGTVNVGLQGRFAEWAGNVLPCDRDIVLVGDPALAAEAKLRLAGVGLDRVVGQLTDPASVFAERPGLVERSSRLTIGQLAELQGLEPDLQLVDVRAAAETAGGTIPGAIEIPLAVLADSLDALDRGLPVVAYCASGYRSQLAASGLAAAGFRDVSDLLGGDDAWERAGLPAAHGADWSGAAPIARVEVSIKQRFLARSPPHGDRHRHSWQWWELLTILAQPGTNSIRARATDLARRTQPGQPPLADHTGQAGRTVQGRSAPPPARRASAPAGHPGPGLGIERRADRARSR